MSDTVSLCSRNIPGYVKSALERLCSQTFYVNANPGLSGPVASHADLSFFLCGRDAIIAKNADSETAEQISEFCRCCGFTLKPSDSEVKGRYPGETALCAAVGPDYLICREVSCDKAVLLAASDSGKRIIPVNQGYAACSCSVLSDGAVITEDRGIAAVLDKAGVSCLLTDKKAALLPGYDRDLSPGGFIGGSCGRLGNTVYFAGDISLHPRYDRILEFAAAHKTDIKGLGDGPLTDVGSIFFGTLMDNHKK